MQGLPAEHDEHGTNGDKFMLTIVEMRQELGRHVEAMSKIQKASEKDRRDFTIDEQAQWNSLETEVRRLEGAISRGEIQERREADMAMVAHRNGESHELGSFSRGGNKEIEVADEVIPPSGSFQEYMESRGLIRNRELAGLSLGALMRAQVTGPRTREERAALAEGSDSTGGVSVPDITLSRFVDKLRANVVCIKAGAQTVPLTSDKTTIARTASDPVAGWRSENAAIGESEPTFEGIVFTARSLDVLVKASREVIEDSVNIVSALEAALIGAMAVEVDRVCLIGSGTPPEPKGISGITNVGSVASGGALTSYDKVLDAVYEILVDNGPMPSAMMMPPRTMIAWAKLKEATTNAPLPKPPLIASIPIYATTSLPITESPGTASQVIMGDFSQLYIGVRTSLQIEILRELFAGNYQFGWIAHLRMDVGVAHPESFCRITGIVP